MSNIITHDEGIGRKVRPLYKRERRPARIKGFLGDCPPLACPDASAKEIISAVGIIAEIHGIQIGRALDYDRAKDVYIVLGSSISNGTWDRVQEWAIPGEYVSTHIKMWRQIMQSSGPADALSWKARQQTDGHAGRIVLPGLPA